MDGRPDRMIAGSVAFRASRQNLFMIDLPTKANSEPKTLGPFQTAWLFTYDAGGVA